MKTVQMTIDDDLIKTVDRIVKKLKTSRSAFTREALREAITRYNINHLESQHKKGYAQHPETQNEFSVWEEEQDWGDE